MTEKCSSARSLVFLVKAFILITLVGFVGARAASAQCQDQTCTDAGHCYQCTASNGHGCTTSSCDSCTSSRCQQLPIARNLDPKVIPAELVKAWERCQNGESVEPTSTQIQDVLSNPGMAVEIFQSQYNEPLPLMSATHGLKDLLKSGKVLNISTRIIKGYRIGWVYEYPGRSSEVVLGNWVRVPVGLKPMNFGNVPPQNASAGPINNGAKLVQFFVAEVKFADNSNWKADLTDIKQLKLPPTPTHPAQSGVTGL